MAAATFPCWLVLRWLGWLLPTQHFVASKANLPMYRVDQDPGRGVVVVGAMNFAVVGLVGTLYITEVRTMQGSSP